MKCMRPGKCSGTGLRPEVAIDTGVLIGKYRSHAMIIVLLGNYSRRKVADYDEHLESKGD